MHPCPPPGLLGTGDNLAGERVQKIYGSLCQMQQGGLADVTEHVHGPFHLPERPRWLTDKYAQSHNMLGYMGPSNSVLPI